MKKFCFVLFITAALVLFCMLSCSRTDSLYDILSSAVASESDMPAGKILCYGQRYENSMSFGTLSDSLGLEGYPAFAEKIEDFVLYSTINGEYSEVALIRVYRAEDAKDAAMLFERRITDAKRTLAVSNKEGNAKNGYVEVRGNIVSLFMLPEDSELEKKIKKAL